MFGDNKVFFLLFVILAILVAFVVIKARSNRSPVVDIPMGIREEESPAVEVQI